MASGVVLQSVIKARQRPTVEISILLVDTRIITTADYPAWDRYISSHATPGVYSTTGWKQAVEISYGHKSFYLGAFDGEQLVGALPLVLLRPLLGQASLVSPPYCDYGGLLAENPAIAKVLLQAAIDHAARLQAVLEIRLPEPCPVLEQSRGFFQVTDKCRMVLALPQSAATLWNGFKSKLRAQVSRAMKHGLLHRIGGKELLEDFYLVFSRNMRDLGSPVHSRKWLRAVFDASGAAAKVGVIYRDACPAAAGIVLTHSSYATVPWASSLREFNSLGTNMLLYWRLLEHAADNGFRYFDFGRSTLGEGTHAFKKQWGAEPSPLYWYRHGNANAPMVRSPADSPKRAVLEWTWSKLPVAVANMVGPPIRKHISR